MKGILISSAATLTMTLALFSSPFAREASGSPPETAQHAARPGDLSGVWMPVQGATTFSLGEPPLQPWAAAKYRSARPGNGPHAGSESQDPILSCDPPGIPRLLLLPFPMQIIQIPGQVMMLFEYDHFIRQIFFDRRTHPGDLDPTWMGDSVGHWEGNTLVVDTVGLNDKTWLDQVGHPHSDALHVVERFHRVDHDTLKDDLTIDDPKAYTQSWKGQQTFKLKPAWHLMEYVCEDTLNRSNP